MNIGSLNTPFIYRGEELIYPNYVKDGLVLHYDFSGMTNADTSRGIAKDLSGNGNHGELQNFNFTEESGYEGKGLKFDGVDDRIISINPLFYQQPENQSWSVELVLKTHHLDEGTVVNKLVSGINLGLDLRKLGSDDTQVTFLNYVANSAVSYLYSSNKINLGELVHVVFSYDSSKLENKIVINSSYIDSLIIQFDTFPPTGMQKNLSFSNKKNVFYSTKIYNRTLTPEEIAHNYAIEKERFNIQEV